MIDRSFLLPTVDGLAKTPWGTDFRSRQTGEIKPREEKLELSSRLVMYSSSQRVHRKDIPR
jgi:hypothetical protein